jgi:hypothetical protein
LIKDASKNNRREKGKNRRKKGKEEKTHGG